MVARDSADGGIAKNDFKTLKYMVFFWIKKTPNLLLIFI